MMMKASISLVFGIVATVAVLIATPVAAQEAPRLLTNLYGWPCPPGYKARGRFGCEIITTFRSAAERDRLRAEAVRSAAKWQAELAERKQREQEAKEAEHLKQEVERERLQAREAEAEQRAAEARTRAAEDRRRAAEARRLAADAAAEEKGRAAEAERRATEEERRAAEAERRAAEVERAKRESEARQNEEQQQEPNRSQSGQVGQGSARAESQQKSSRYTPAIERAYAARGVAGIVLTECADHLDVNIDKVRELEEEAGLGKDEKPNLDVTRRATQAAMTKLAEAGVKHGMRRSELQLKQNQCLLFLYAFGPQGTAIKGLVSER